MKTNKQTNTSSQSCVVTLQTGGRALAVHNTFPSQQNSFARYTFLCREVLESCSLRAILSGGQAPGGQSLSHCQAQTPPMQCWEPCVFPSGLFHGSVSILAASFRIPESWSGHKRPGFRVCPGAIRSLSQQGGSWLYKEKVASVWVSCVLFLRVMETLPLLR